MTNETIMSVNELARVMYSVPDGEKPTKAQRNNITRLCRSGKLDASKVGAKWIIRVVWPDNEARKARSMQAKSVLVKPRANKAWKVPRVVM